MIKFIKVDKNGLIKVITRTRPSNVINNSLLITRELHSCSILYNTYIKNDEIYFKIEKNSFNNNDRNIVNKSLINLLKSIEDNSKILNTHYNNIKIDYNKLLLNLHLPSKYYNKNTDYKNIIKEFMDYYKYNQNKINGFNYFFPTE